MRLRTRLALTVALSAALAILLAAAAFWTLSVNQQRSGIDEGIVRVASQPRRLLADFRGGNGNGGRPQVPQVFEGEDALNDRLFTRVKLTVDNEVVFDQGLPAPDPNFDRNSGIQVSTVEVDGERFRMATSALPDNERFGVVQVARNIEDLEAGLGRLRRQILMTSLAGIALAGLLGALVAQRLTAPIRAVADAASGFALRNDMPERIEVTRSDEVGELATSFNQMLAALQLSREQQQRLVGDASHELRTPLTSLRIKLDLLDSTPDLSEEQRIPLLASSAAEVEQLGELVQELVHLATDPTNVVEESAMMSLLSLTSDVVDQQKMRTGRTIELTSTGDAALELRPRMVTRAVSNLIDNAVKYSPEGQPIKVSVSGDRVEVRDYGPGIDEEDLEHIFDRFYRSKTARTRPGNGIGLAIVRRVAELHGGTTWVRNAEDPGGAIVGFSVKEAINQ